MSAPWITISGARSPPIASRAMVIVPGTGAAPRAGQCRSGGGRLRRHHFAAVVIAAGRAQMMRPLQLAAIRTFGIDRRRQLVMRPAHIAARRRDLLFWDGHWALVE